MHKEAIGLHVRVILEKSVNLHLRGFGYDFLRFSQMNGYADFTESLYLFNICVKRLDYLEHTVMYNVFNKIAGYSKLALNTILIFRRNGRTDFDETFH